MWDEAGRALKTQNVDDAVTSGLVARYRDSIPVVMLDEMALFVPSFGNVSISESDLAQKVDDALNKSSAVETGASERAECGG